MDKIKVVILAGPTASGKTRLGVDLALNNNAEVISADSMQIYKRMSVATAKPTEDEMRGVPHHLIDFLEPTEKYSVARFVEDAGAAIRDISSRGKVPIIVGGTGLYIDSLINGIVFSEQKDNSEVRQKLYEEADAMGNDYMYRRLMEIDPEYANTLHPNNKGRVLRALELNILSGVTMSEQLKESRKSSSPYSPLFLGIDFTDRERLYERINLRVDMMLQSALLEEATAFFKRYNSETAAQAIGYKELRGYIDGTETLSDCVERLKRETRRYAKRQLTWFRRNEAMNWLYADSFENYEQMLQMADRLVKGFIEAKE